MKAKSRRSSEPPVVSPVGQILGTEQVAKLLGVSQRTIQEMIRTGKLQAVRVGKRYRILDRHIQALFGENVLGCPRIASTDLDDLRLLARFGEH